jgi:hypothetical protein
VLTLKSRNNEKIIYNENSFRILTQIPSYCDRSGDTTFSLFFVSLLTVNNFSNTVAENEIKIDCTVMLAKSVLQADYSTSMYRHPALASLSLYTTEFPSRPLQ